jgi:hypothetical protein
MSEPGGIMVAIKPSRQASSRMNMITERLPPEGPLQIGSVTLPAGVHILSEYGTGQGVAWATIQRVAEPGKIWAALSAAHPQTGLVPFLLEGIDLDDPASTQRPWDQGEFEDPADIAGLDLLDAAGLLESRWNGHLAPLDEGQQEDPGDILVRLPFSRRFPGLAPAQTTSRDPRELQLALSLAQGPARIGLAAADRPADVLARIGWTGHPAPLELAAVLRSWEDRFGARLLQIGFDRIWLLVERPPGTADAALRLAAEHYVFADECHHAMGGNGTVPGIAIYLLSTPAWIFWWD